MKLGLIVEGHGETTAMPILVRRIAERIVPSAPPNILLPPFRVTKGLMLKANELERAVEFVCRKTGPDGKLLIVVDADDDCPVHLGAELLRRARRARGDREIRVVVACREFETWFLAGLAGIRGYRGIPTDAGAPVNFAELKNPKAWFDQRLTDGYHETIDQAKLTTRLDLDAARRDPSFDKLWRDLAALIGPPPAVPG